MKLKNSVTREQLEELGFKDNGFSVFEYEMYAKDKVDGYIEISIFFTSYSNKEIKIEIYNTYDGLYSDNLLLKMFKLGYIEESE